MSDYSELKRLAEAAGSGEWGYDGSYVCPARKEGGTTYVESWHAVADTYQVENTKFIAAANPAVVLALIAENEAAKEFKAHMVSLRETHGFDSWASALVEIDKLRKDAERYRGMFSDGGCFDYSDKWLSKPKAEVDALIDAGKEEAPADPFKVCLHCFGDGTICTGIEEASSTICNACDGTGSEKE